MREAYVRLIYEGLYKVYKNITQNYLKDKYGRGKTFVGSFVQ